MSRFRVLRTTMTAITAIRKRSPQRLFSHGDHGGTEMFDQAAWSNSPTGDPNARRVLLLPLVGLRVLRASVVLMSSSSDAKHPRCFTAAALTDETVVRSA